jgi:hypothetical protein
MTAVAAVFTVVLMESMLCPAVMIALAAAAMLTVLPTVTEIIISHFGALLVYIQALRAAHSFCRRRQQRKNRTCRCENESETTCHHVMPPLQWFQLVVQKDRSTH